jgi:hypothetical protein
MPPITDLGIVVSESGGEDAAAALDSINTRLTETGRSAAQMGVETSAGQNQITAALQRGGVRLLGLELGHSVTAMTGFTGAGRATHTVIHSLLAAAGPLALGIGAIAGAAALAYAAYEHHNKEAAKTKDALEKNYKAAKDMTTAFEEAANKGEKLSTAAQHMVASFRQWQALGPGDPEIKKATKAYDDAANALATFTTDHRAAIRAMSDGNATIVSGQEHFSTLRQELARLQAAADQAYVNLKKMRGEIKEDGTTAEAAATKLTAAQQRIIDKIAFHIEMIDALRAAEKKEADEAANAARETHDHWMQATAGIQQSFTQLGVGLIDSMRTGTQTAGQLFTQFGESVIAELERMAVQAAITNIFSSLIPGGPAVAGGIAPGAGVAPAGGLLGLFGLQHGGDVPGPIGQPIPIIAHGGERVERASARTDRGGGDTINLNFRGGIGGLNAPDQRMIGRQMRGLIRMGGELGWV